MYVVKNLEGILLSSENTTKLAEFYRDIVGLELTMEFEMGEEGFKGYAFDEAQLYINPHSEVKGKNPNPQRIILNFEVDNIEEDVARLKKAGVKQIQDTYHVENYGLISTFEDPDGNFFQLVQTHEPLN